MKARNQMLASDGFDTNVAEKMPKIKKLDEPEFITPEIELPQREESLIEEAKEIPPVEKPVEKKANIEPQPKAGGAEPGLDVLKLIEDLHGQLLVASRTKRALEMDLSSYQKTVQQLAQDNKELRSHLEIQGKELQKLKEIQSESLYLAEENAEALERIRAFQQELREMKDTLARTGQERDESLRRTQELESQMELGEILRVKGKLREREASHFAQESQELQSRLEEALAQNLDLEKKYNALKLSFNEVKESLSILRDSCKTNYYNLSDSP
jgi:chromosome segregation ATPase